MYVANITTTDYDNITDNCTNNQNNKDAIVPTILLSLPCGLSFLCLMSLMIYTLIKPLREIDNTTKHLHEKTLLYLNIF